MRTSRVLREAPDVRQSGSEEKVAWTRKRDEKEEIN